MDANFLNADWSSNADERVAWAVQEIATLEIMLSPEWLARRKGTKSPRWAANAAFNIEQTIESARRYLRMGSVPQELREAAKPVLHAAKQLSDELRAT